MGIVKFPPEIIERTEIVCHDGPFPLTVSQSAAGTVLVESIKPSAEPQINILVGDALLSINDTPVELMDFAEVMDMLNNESRPFTVTFGRSSDAIDKQIHVEASRVARESHTNEEAERMALLRAQEMQRHGVTNNVRVRGAKQNQQVYTAKDFKTFRFNKFQKTLFALLVLLMFAMVILFSKWGESFAVDEERAFNEFAPEHASTPALRGATAPPGSRIAEVEETETNDRKPAAKKPAEDEPSTTQTTKEEQNDAEITNSTEGEESATEQNDSRSEPLKPDLNTTSQPKSEESLGAVNDSSSNSQVTPSDSDNPSTEAQDRHN